MSTIDLHSMTLSELITFFEKLGIPTNAPGFYDHPALVELEKSGTDTLSGYARFVLLRQYSTGYLDSVRSQIITGAAKLSELLIADGRLGACIDCSLSFSRMLDEMGIWNYTVKGALGIQFPTSTGFAPFNFWPVDEDDGSGREFGHKWVVAPPFKVIDLTLKLQDYSESFAYLLPDCVLFEEADIIQPTFKDILSPAALRYAHNTDASSEESMFVLLPHLRDIFRTFAAYHIAIGGVDLRYATCGFGASDCPLREITSLTLGGLPALALFVKEIRPAMQAATH